MDKSRIKNIVHDIRTSKSAIKEQIFTVKYPAFAKSYPSLFKAALDPHFDLKHLDMMLDMLDQVNSKKQNIEQVHEKVQTTLNAQYIDPIIEKLPKNENPIEPVFNITNPDEMVKIVQRDD